MKSIGINIGKKKCVASVMNQKGTVLEGSSYENTIHGAKEFAAKMRLKYQKCQAVCEATGNMWIKTYEAFEEQGIPIMLANTYKLKII